MVFGGEQDGNPVLKQKGRNIFSIIGFQINECINAKPCLTGKSSGRLTAAADFFGPQLSRGPLNPFFQIIILTLKEHARVNVCR
jgi:hypothetical protein